MGIGERAAKRATLPLQITPAGCTLKTNASPMSRFIFWPTDEFGLCCVAKSNSLDVIWILTFFCLKMVMCPSKGLLSTNNIKKKKKKKKEAVTFGKKI